MRRDLLVAWSYRLPFVADVLGLVLGAVTFYFIAQIVVPTALPAYGAERATYMEFVGIGIALGAFVSFGLTEIARVVRSEQLMGTLESVLMTPVWPLTIQIGSVAFDLIYIPVRTALFLTVIALSFGLDYRMDGLLPATAFLCLFIPFVWGLGLAGAAATLTFRGGSGVTGLAGAALSLGSGAFFPIALLPGGIDAVAQWNPMAIALEGVRRALIGGFSWADMAAEIGLLAVAAAASLGLGALAFRVALERERRRGTIGLY